MNNRQYIASLKKALAGLDKTSIKDIVQEIESHAAESGASLIDQFGSSEVLAKQYLDGEKITKPLSTKVWGLSQTLIKICVIALIALIAFISLFAYLFTKDKFDYANEAASELAEGSWQSMSWSSNLLLNIDQASVIVYWHDANTVRWKCDGSGFEKQEDDSLLIRQSHCYLYLPKVVTSIQSEQSQVVFVRPQTSLMVNARQASIKIAENGKKYKYITNTDRSQFTGLQSHEGAKYTLQFTIKESMISNYEY